MFEQVLFKCYQINYIYLYSCHDILIVFHLNCKFCEYRILVRSKEKLCDPEFKKTLVQVFSKLVSHFIYVYYLV